MKPILKIAPSDRKSVICDYLMWLLTAALMISCVVFARYS